MMINVGRMVAVLAAIAVQRCRSGANGYAL